MPMRNALASQAILLMFTCQCYKQPSKELSAPPHISSPNIPGPGLVFFHQGLQESIQHSKIELGVTTYVREVTDFSKALK
jgi:hypothetical protein